MDDSRRPVVADRASRAPVPHGSAGTLPGTRYPAVARRPAAPAWPLFTGLGPVGALPTAARVARMFTVMVLAGWELDALAETAELIASELVSNVVRAATLPDGQPRYDDHGRLPVLWLRLLSDRAGLQVEVWDNLPAALGVPAARHAGPDEESGRGLEMVRELSTDWGWDHPPGRDAKRVWALLVSPAAATPQAPLRDRQ